jgi:hypothetical protein
MHTDPIWRVLSSRMLILILFIAMLTGCGSNSTTSSPTPTPSIGKSSAVSIDVAGLHIQSSEGIQCPLGASSSLTVSQNLVLATERLTYSQNEIQQIENYLNAIFNSSTSANSYLVAPPDTLTWVSGSTSCAAKLQITNTGSGVVQIPSAGIQLTQTPRQNSYQYRTIDTCTILTRFLPACFVPSTVGSCGVYYANIQLNAVNQPSNVTGDLFAIPPVNQTTCGELTLNPNATIDMLLNFSSSGTPANFIYSVTPQLTVSTTNGTHSVSLSQLAGRLTFADKSQFSCYKLVGNTFVLETTRPPSSYCM